jgi:hypothetical protein
MALAFPDCDARINPEGEILEIPTGSCPQKLPESGDVLGPWVAVKFEGSGSVITVSNKSSPSTRPKHVAVVQSFEYGFQDGLTVRVTIQDQQGGSFVTFMEHMLKHYACLKNGNPAALRMQFQWGWVKSGCKYPMPNAKSPCHYAIVDSIETNFTEGKFIAEITGKDTGWRMLEGGGEKIFGEDGEGGICLRDALKQLLVSSESPNVTSIKLLRMQGGAIVPCPFEYGCEDEGRKKKLLGPKGKWISQGQDKLRSALRWLEGWRTDKKKGWKPQYNSLVPGGEIIFWEDRQPKCTCQGDAYWDSNCIGKYIVNGGKKSPVIEFNPKIRWDFGRMVSVGGATANETPKPLPEDGSKSPGRRECGSLTRAANPGAGQTLQTPNTENHKGLFGKDGVNKKQLADEEAMRSLKVLHDDITADLVIVGDPTLLPPSQSIARNVHIVFINPYHLMGGKGCTDWIAKPVINEVLTNKAWVVNSVTHRIEAGNYTTTVEVFLAAPGKHGEAGEPIGLWCGGWKPKVC